MAVFSESWHSKQTTFTRSTVGFVEQKSFHSPDTCEDECYHKLDAKINIQSVMIPL